MTSSVTWSSRARILCTVCSWSSPSMLSPFTASTRSPSFIPACSAGSPTSTSHRNWPATAGQREGGDARRGELAVLAPMCR